jgi:protein-disulfide isomerase-like protein with CxxC motif
MPHFKGPQGALYFLSDEDVAAGWDSQLPVGVVPVSDAEAQLLRSIDQNIIPQVVTRRQALLALLAADKLDQIDLLIQNAPRAVQIAWAAAGTFERNSPLIAALAPQVGLTEADIDNLFTEAAAM